jgi:hypothetical protein
VLTRAEHDLLQEESDNELTTGELYKQDDTINIFCRDRNGASIPDSYTRGPSEYPLYLGHGHGTDC